MIAQETVSVNRCSRKILYKKPHAKSVRFFLYADKYRNISYLFFRLKKAFLPRN